jgi:hypothetical protein
MNPAFTTSALLAALGTAVAAPAVAGAQPIPSAARGPVAAALDVRIAELTALTTRILRFTILRGSKS